MRLCSFDNQTIAVTELVKEIMAVENKIQITGWLGKCLDNMFCRIEKRKCILRGVHLAGTKHNNGSYDGAIGLLESKQVDLFLKAESEFIDEPSFLIKTNPIKTEQIFAFHTLTKSEKVNYFNLLDNFKFGIELFSAYSITIGICLIFYFCLINQFKRIKKLGINYFLNLLLLNKLSINFSAISIFLIFFSLFSWFTLLFITSTIKTNKVVVDTSKLIKNIDELMNTKRTACFAKDDSQENIAISLPKTALFSKLYFEKTPFKLDHKDEIAIYGKRCILGRYSSPVPKFIDNWVFIVNEVAKLTGIAMLAFTNMSYRFWISNPIYQFNSVFYFNLRNPINIKYHEQRDQYFEHGHFEKLYNCFRNNVYFASFKIVKQYDKLTDYIDDEVKFSNLELDNFKYIFLIYFILCSFIFSLFLIGLIKFKKIISCIHYLRIKFFY